MLRFHTLTDLKMWKTLNFIPFSVNYIKTQPNLVDLINVKNLNRSIQNGSEKIPGKILSLWTKTSNLPTFLFLLYHSNESRLHSRKVVSRRWSSEVFRKILQMKDFAKPTKPGFMHTSLLNHTRHWMSSLWWHGVIINFF